MSGGTDAAESPGGVMRHRAFACAWAARALSTLSYQMQAVAVGWQVYELTLSPLYLGYVGLAQFLPALALVFVVGHVADRFERRRVVGGCQVLEALTAAALAIGSFQGWPGIAPILVIVVLFGAAKAFEGPTLQALIPGLVPRDELPKALAWTASGTQTAIIVGPAAGGLLYIAGPTVVYATAAALLLLASVLIGRIRHPAPALRREPVSLRSVFAGISFIRSRPPLLGAISLDLFAVLLGGATALLPIFARDILGTGPLGLGLLRLAPAVGALAMSLWLARHPLLHRPGRTMFIAVAVFGVATIVFGLSRSLALSMFALLVLGASDMVSVVIRQSLVQLRTPDDMRGRVSAVNSVFIGSSNQLGEFESGVTAEWFGTVPAVVIGGVGTLVVVAAWVRLFPQLFRMNHLREFESRP